MSDDAGRHLHFVRHGQYEASAGGGVLTAIGRRQLQRTGKRLAAMGATTVVSSDLTRAVESAAILSEELRVKPRKSRLLREMLPTGVKGWTVPLATRARGRANLEAISEGYFRPCRGTRHEVIVCHGNLIRALWCLTFGIPLTRWLRLDIHNGSITTFRVAGGDAPIRLVRFNDHGHLSGRLVTES